MMRSAKGSFTVETALLFPLIMTSIIVVIYMSFLIHDRTVMSVACYQAAMRAARITDKNVDVKDKAEKACRELTEDRLISTRISKIDASVNSGQVELCCNGNFIIPDGVIWIRELKSRGYRIEIKKKASRLNPTEHVRIIRRVRSR